MSDEQTVGVGEMAASERRERRDVRTIGERSAPDRQPTRTNIDRAGHEGDGSVMDRTALRDHVGVLSERMGRPVTDADVSGALALAGKTEATTDDMQAMLTAWFEREV